MEYRINNTLISTWGLAPSPVIGDVAARGLLDMPKRSTPTEYDWKTSTEPFVDAQDITFEGRDIELSLVATASSLTALLANMASFTTACKLEGATLLTPFGTFNVWLNGELTIKPNYNQAIAMVTARFFTTDTYFPTLGTSVGTASFNIDGYGMFQNFGTLLVSHDNLLSTGQSIEIENTAKARKPQHRQPKDVHVSCITQSSTMAGIKTNIGLLSTLLAKAGTRTMQVPVGPSNNVQVAGYCRDGLTVNWVRKADKWYAEFYFKLRVP
jgi:hypothetical protein